MQKKFNKDSDEWNLFQDFWKLAQKFWIPEDGDDYWQDLIYETGLFYDRYNTKFSEKLRNALINECRDKWKETHNHV